MQHKNKLTGGSSLIVDRWINKLPLPRKWTLLAIGLLLFLLPLGIAYLEGISHLILVDGIWRSLFIQPVLVTYVLILSQPLQHTREVVAQALRSIMQLDDESFHSLVERACQTNPIGELIGFGLGVVFIFSLGARFELFENAYWLSRYIYLSAILMWGMIGWTTYAAFSVIRLTRELLKQPLAIDLFDPKPFEPIGRQSLMLSLAFIGGITLSLIFSFDPSTAFQISTWIIYGCLLLVTVLVFFFNMRDTHRVLSDAKDDLRASVDRSLSTALYKFQELSSSGEDTQLITAEINTWAVFKQEVKGARVWPYNTEMLQTLTVSVLLPLIIGLARIIALLFPLGIRRP
jgi:hypothetical protein